MQTVTTTLPPALAAIAAGRDHLNTNEAAAAICHRPQTLRLWASTGNGALRPVRVGRRLCWPVADIARLLNGGV